MEKILLTEYLLEHNKKPFMRYLKYDDFELRTVEEWDEFFKEKFGK